MNILLQIRKVSDFQILNELLKKYVSDKDAEYPISKIRRHQELKAQLLEQYILRQKCIQINTGQSVREIANTYFIIAISYSGVFILWALLVFIYWCCNYRGERKYHPPTPNKQILCFKIRNEYLGSAVFTCGWLLFWTALICLDASYDLNGLIVNPSQYKLITYRRPSGP